MKLLVCNERRMNLRICVVDFVFHLIEELCGNCFIKALNTRGLTKLTTSKYKALWPASGLLVCQFATYCNFPTVFTKIELREF